MSESSKIELLRQSLPESELRARLKSCSPSELEAILYDWRQWARPNQLPPGEFSAGVRSTWLILAGRGYGKTRTGAEMVRLWHQQGYRFVNLIARTSDDLRRVMVEGESGILATCRPEERPRASKDRLVWPNGAVSLLFSAEEPDKLRGPQSDKIWADEVASWRYAEDAWDQAMFGLRLGDNPQAVVTTTPRPTKFIKKKLMAEPATVITRGTTYENRSNLAPGFFSRIIKKYEGTRLGRQELQAEVLDDNPGALFTIERIEGGRITKLPPMVRIVVALDPAVTSEEDSDEWGVVAAGVDGRDPAHFYILTDDSEIYTPDEAAKVGVRLYHRLSADRIIGEANNGGDMIEALIRHQDANVSYKKVTASRGKIVRAEPVSALYEQGRVHHHGTLAKLEDQMTSWNPKTGEKSPDRMDACFIAGTMIATRRGDVPIESVRAGDEALTRQGWRKVLRSECTNHNAPIRRFGPLTGTSGHPIYTANRGFISLDSLVWDDTLLTWSKECGFREFDIPATQTQRALQIGVTSRLRGALDCLRSIRRCGLQRMAQFLAATRSTTATSIRRTMRWITSNASPVKNMPRFAQGGVVPRNAPTWGACGHWRPPGIARKLEALCTRSQQKSDGRTVHATFRSSATDAVMPSRALLNAMGRAIVAGAAIERRQIANTATSIGCRARSAEPNSGKANIESSQSSARVSAVRNSASSAPVYNLEVEGEHEYFANGILVHNCVWALTELAEGSGGWGGFVRSEGEEAIRQENPGALPRVDVSGGNHDICDCGSRVWCDNGPTAKQTCFRCGKERPE